MSHVDFTRRVAQLSPQGREQLATKLGALRATDNLINRAPPTTLVAYYTTVQEDIPNDELRRFLADLLPAHLIPSLYCRVDHVPRTPHGKVDTSALPDPLSTVAAYAHASDDAPSEVESQLIQIWKTVLNVNRLGRQDSFFELGGDSLLAIRLLGLIRDQWSIDLSMSDLFDHPTVAAAAAQIDAVLWARSSSGSQNGEHEGGREAVEF